MEKQIKYRDDLVKSAIDMLMVGCADVDRYICRSFEFNPTQWMIENDEHLNDNELEALKIAMKNYIHYRHKSYCRLMHRYELEHVRFDDNRCYCYYKEIPLKSL